MKSYDFLTKVDGYRRNIIDVLGQCLITKGANVLDAGSGTGNLSLLMKAQGAQVVSCDFSRSALEVHRLKDPDAVLVEASLEDRLPFEKQSFDCVCCVSVLFALSKSGCGRAVKEFNRVLKPGGRLVVTVPAAEASLKRFVELYFDGMFARYGWLSGVVRSILNFKGLVSVLYYNYRLKKLPDWQGFHYFSEHELAHLLESAGFTSVKTTRTYGSVFMLAVAKKEI